VTLVWKRSYPQAETCIYISAGGAGGAVGSAWGGFVAMWPLWPSPIFAGCTLCLHCVLEFHHRNMHMATWPHPLPPHACTLSRQFALGHTRHHSCQHCNFYHSHNCGNRICGKILLSALHPQRCPKNRQTKMKCTRLITPGAYCVTGHVRGYLCQYTLFQFSDGWHLTRTFGFGPVFSVPFKTKRAALEAVQSC